MKKKRQFFLKPVRSLTGLSFPYETTHANQYLFKKFHGLVACTIRRKKKIHSFFKSWIRSWLLFPFSYKKKKKAHFPFPFFTAGRFLSNKYRRRGGERRRSRMMETISNTDRNGGKRRQNPSRQKTESRGNCFWLFPLQIPSSLCEEAFWKTRQKKRDEISNMAKTAFYRTDNVIFFHIIATKGIEGEPLKAAVGKGLF